VPLERAERYTAVHSRFFFREASLRDVEGEWHLRGPYADPSALRVSRGCLPILALNDRICRIRWAGSLLEPRDHPELPEPGKVGFTDLIRGVPTGPAHSYRRSMRPRERRSEYRFPRVERGVPESTMRGSGRDIVSFHPWLASPGEVQDDAGVQPSGPSAEIVISLASPSVSVAGTIPVCGANSVAGWWRKIRALGFLSHSMGWRIAIVSAMSR
jgi:hypothetical protein